MESGIIRSRLVRSYSSRPANFTASRTSHPTSSSGWRSTVRRGARATPSHARSRALYSGDFVTRLPSAKLKCRAVKGHLVKFLVVAAALLYVAAGVAFAGRVWWRASAAAGIAALLMWAWFSFYAFGLVAAGMRYRYIARSWEP